MECTSTESISPIAVDHARKPRNLGVLKDFNGHARITGPCGDTMEFWLRVQDDKIDKVSFLTDGCGHSLACGSMTTCLVEGAHIETAARFQQKDVLEALNGLPGEFEHCALLAVNTLKAACENYFKNSRAK